MVIVGGADTGGLMSQMIQLFPGDVFAVIGAYEHHIIYTGVRDWSQQDIIHNDKSGGVQRARLQGLVAGQRCKLVRRFVGNAWQREQAVRFALSLEGTRYDLLNFNCEHFSSLVQTGRPESPQLQALAVTVVAGIGLMWLVRSV